MFNYYKFIRLLNYCGGKILNQVLWCVLHIMFNGNEYHIHAKQTSFVLLSYQGLRH